MSNEAYNKLIEKYPELARTGAEFHKALQKEIVSAKVKKEQSDLDVDMTSITNINTKRKPLTEQQKNNIKQYGTKLVNAPAVQGYRNAKRKGNDLLDIKTAKLLFFDIMQVLSDKPINLETQKAVIGGRVQPYKVLLSELVYYLVRSKKGVLSQNKGLMLVGAAGFGKTYLMKCAATFTRIAANIDMYKAASDKTKMRMIERHSTNIHKDDTVVPFDTSFRYVTIDKILQEVRENEDFSVITRKYLHGDICYDDVGFRSEQVNNYGDKTNVFVDIISRQYERCMKTDKTIHMTTNLLPTPNGGIDPNNTILGRYGQRILSRCRQLFNVITLVGKDLRG